jgi:predicted outer membrane repeat protein
MATAARIASLLALIITTPTIAATRTVTDTGDNGDGTCDATCTLRDAVDASQADDRILFDLALPSPVVIGLTGAPLQIDVAMRIIGTDGVPTTVRRTANTGRLLDVVAGGDARIIGLGFENGTVSAAFGANAEGGAVLVAAGGALELRDCVLRGNRASGGAAAPATGNNGGTGRGGAIYAEGDLLVEGCAFVDNQALGGAGGDSVVSTPGGNGGSASGGAIHAEASLDIVNSTFSDNRAPGGRGGNGSPSSSPGLPGMPGGNGGNASGGAVQTSNSSTASIAFTTLIGNVVAGGNGGAGGTGMPIMPGDPPLNGPPGSPGTASGAAVATLAASILNVSVVAANTGADQCAGGALLTARTTNAVTDASCPGSIVAALETQFDAIDPMFPSPHYLPKFDSVVVDAAPDCLDAVAFELVDLDQLLTPRPLTTFPPAGRCDIGAIEFNPVLFGDGFEEPPPPP